MAICVGWLAVAGGREICWAMNVLFSISDQWDVVVVVHVHGERNGLGRCWHI